MPKRFKSTQGDYSNKTRSRTNRPVRRPGGNKPNWLPSPIPPPGPPIGDGGQINSRDCQKMRSAIQNYGGNSLLGDYDVSELIKLLEDIYYKT